MGVFEMIILVVIITTVGKIGLNLTDHLGELMKASAAERRARKAAIESGEPLARDVVEELEHRLTRIEDRLDFLEELRAPDRRPSLRPGPSTQGRESTL
jgi:hypothetical protein